MTPPVGVLTFGETMASMRCPGPLRIGASLRLSVAGAESNVAIGLARLGHRVRWTGVVGNDPLGLVIVRALRAEGVEVSARTDVEAPTGIVVFEERLADVTRVLYRRSGSAGSRLEPADVDAAFADAPPELVHLTGVTPALGESPRRAVARAAALARGAGATVCFNVNYRSMLWSEREATEVISPLASSADIVLATRSELALVVPDTDPSHPSQTEEVLAGRLLDQGVTEVVVTAGPDGATLYRSDGSWHRPAPTVRAVDSVGAGDAFVAGYLAGHLEKLGTEERLQQAATVAGFAVATEGDWEGLPVGDELPLLTLEAGVAVR